VFPKVLGALMVEPNKFGRWFVVDPKLLAPPPKRELVLELMI
jgi:hypothetical protein